MRAPMEVRFWHYVEKTEGCWNWTGGTSKGYGRFTVHRGTTPVAHRVAWEMLRGAIPAGAQLDHLCRNRSCVRPEHLEPVTCRINLLRGRTHAAANAAKTECPQGHVYDDTNTYVDRRGARQCRECSRARRRQWYANKKAAA